MVYVANGSHASYPRAGVADRPWPDPNDEADGRGREVRPAVTMITSSQPAWVSDPGRWGDSRAGIVPGEQSSPHGPMFQDDRRWQEPAEFVDGVGLACGTSPPGRAWQTAGIVGIAAAAAGLLLWRRRRA